MKKIMTGNEAIARGAYEAGCKVATAYPGTPSTEILENIAANYEEIYSEWSVNEKVALEVAGGAAIAGVRSLCAMKHVGLNVAADPFFTLAYTGINGGLVVVTADDPGLHSSQNEQDNRYYAIHAKVPMIEPSDSQECLDYTKAAFGLSERYDIPVLLRMTTRICHSKSLVNVSKRQAVIKEYKRNMEKYCMIPGFAKKRHPILEEKLKDLREYSNKSPLNRIEWGNEKIGIITSGISYQYAKEIMGDGASYLKIGLSHPMPKKLIREFAANVEKLYIIEENEPYMENFVKSIGIECTGKAIFPICGELSLEIIEKALKPETPSSIYALNTEVPARPPVLCAGCPHRGIFYALKKYKDVIVTGDIGCYSLSVIPPLDVTHTLICMGAGISAGIGFEKALSQAGKDNKKVFGCIGDSTFFHSGITSLINVVYNKSNIVVIILDNRTTAMTGHQQNPGTGKTLIGEISPEVDIEKIVKAVGVKEENVHVVDPYDLNTTEIAIEKAYNAVEPFVIIAKRPCALIKQDRNIKGNLKCIINQDKCTNCKICLGLGCPAILFKNDMMVIDQTACNGCTLCMQVCRFDAIERAGG